MKPETTHSAREQYERLRRICKQAGIKPTHQRIEIFKEVMSAKDHPSAEDIHSRLKASLPSLALDTVYRTLATFSELGIIKKVHGIDPHGRFDPNLDDHHHFICLNCGKIIDFEWKEFDDVPFPEEVKRLGRIVERRGELRGLCRECVTDKDK